MENSAKALLIAGGILISIVVISISMMVYSNVTSLSKQKQEIMDEEELIKYNKEWESYNRNNLKGTDIVTIYNKAMAENAEYEENYGIKNFITIEFSLKDDIKEYYVLHYWDNNKMKSKTSDERTVISGGKKYDTKSNYDKISSFFNNMKTTGNKEIIKDISQIKNIADANTTLKNLDGISFQTVCNNTLHPPYIEHYTPQAAFKLLDFECTNITYNNERVSKISFSEK